jgi:hypothetical protein
MTMEFQEEYATRNKFWNEIWAELRQRRNFLSDKPPMLARDCPKHKESSSKEEL